MPISNEIPPRILVVGCGGIGGVLAVQLLRSGADLSIATTNEQVRAVWATTGPSLGGKLACPPLPPERLLRTPGEGGTKFDVVFVAVQPTQIESVAKEISTCLTERGRVVCLPNGLCEARLAESLGIERVIGAVVAWGARMPRPGDYRRTSSGGFLVGTLHNFHDPQLLPIIALLENVGAVKRTDNLRGARFSKLTINCAISALGTIGGATLGRLLVRRKVRELGLTLMREAIAVAAADGIALEPISRVRLDRLISRGKSGKPLSVAAQHALLLAVGSRYRRLRSSMLSAIERGRTPAIDHINGEIVKLGAIVGVPTPYNQAATELVWALSRGEIRPGNEALTRLERRALELSVPKLAQSVA